MSSRSYKRTQLSEENRIPSGTCFLVVFEPALTKEFESLGNFLSVTVNIYLLQRKVRLLYLERGQTNEFHFLPLKLEKWLKDCFIILNFFDLFWIFLMNGFVLD